MKTWILAIVLAAVAVAPFLYLAYNKMSPGIVIESRQSVAVIEFQPQRPATLEVGGTFMVLACEVIDGYQFALNLDGFNWIDAHLPVATKEEATPVVVELLNSAEPPPPTVTLLRQIGDEHWIVDIAITKDGQRRSLVDLLRTKELLLD
jgi:hypothetical protein